MITGIGILVSPHQPVRAQSLEATLEVAHQHLNQVWIEQFRRLGQSWIPPQAFWYETPIQTPCGIMGRGNAQYCPRNHAIYLHHSFLRQVSHRAGEFAAVTVLAHEYGHAVQALLNLEWMNQYPVQEELQADCFAGVYARAAGAQGFLEAHDLQAARRQSYLSGDPVFHWGSHGTPLQRLGAFQLGFNRGVEACLNPAVWPRP